MRAKYIYELTENKTKEEVEEILVEVVLSFFKSNNDEAEKVWYGKNGIVERNFIQPH